MTSPDVPDDVLDRLRGVCLALPEVHEVRAWVGTRWRIRARTFAHVLGITDEYPPAETREAPLVEDAVVLTFRSDGQELDALANAGPPFYKPSWNRQVIGMIVESDVDWDEVAELLTESYCLLAPKKLAALVARPGDAFGDTRRR
jgi:predicted DNA-binding protein (MmcQ/YjbR family)